jgi:uncharacterized protein YqjF (DUF2071 family)
MYFELNETKHRPFPLPKSPWILTQVWNDMLFLHYQIDPTLLRSYVPEELEIDLYEGKAWISIIPFKITKMRARGLPHFPYLHTYLELNVRTYVKYKGVPGIYFFSLDADKLLAVLGAQVGLGLPYKKAHMYFQQERDQFYFQSVRESSKQTYQLDVQYERKQILYEPLPDSLDFWLLERYSMYSILGNLIIRGDIHHDQWKVSMVHAHISTNTMLDFLQDEKLDPTPQHMHYSRRKRFLFFPPKIVGKIKHFTDK